MLLPRGGACQREWVARGGRRGNIAGVIFILMAGGIAIVAIIATGNAAQAVRQRRWPSAVAWSVMAVPLLLWAANIVLRTAANPALLSNVPP